MGQTSSVKGRTLKLNKVIPNHPSHKPVLSNNKAYHGTLEMLTGRDPLMVVKSNLTFNAGLSTTLPQVSYGTVHPRLEASRDAARSPAGSLSLSRAACPSKKQVSLMDSSQKGQHGPTQEPR